MTTIAAASSTTASAASASAAVTKSDAAKASLDYDAFLKLLVAQMQNQDPLNPTDATQQLSQLASFSNVEQSIKVNQKLDAMITMSALNQANTTIGRTVTSADGATSGVVKSVRVNDDGITATLASGKTMLIDAGVTVE